MIGRRNLITFFCTIFLLLLNISSLHSEEQFEKPPRLNASKILPRALFKSANHQVAEDVINDGYMNTYQISSPFGEFTARSNLQLEGRVHEIAVIADIKKKYPSSLVAKDAALQTGEKIITAPVKAVSKAVDTVSDPERLKNTAKSIPSGAKKLFQFAASTISAGAEFVYDTGKSVFKEDPKNLNSSQDHLGDAVNYISEKGLDYSGYNQAVADLMKAYALNPYTDNEILRSEIRRIARIQTSIGLSGKLVPGIGSIPGVSTFNSYVGKANAIAAYEDPKKIAALNKKMLDTIGSAEGKEVGWEKKFMENQSYTPVTRSILLNNLKLLVGTPGVSSFIESASNAPDREIAGYYMVASTKLLDFHQKIDPLQAVVIEANLPAGLGKRGKLYLPIPVDYLVWTEEVSKIFNGFRDRVVKKYKVKIKSVELHIAGNLTRKCKSELTKLGATKIIENQGYL